MIFDFIRDDPYLILVNRTHQLRYDYVPKDLTYPIVLCDIMDEKKFMRRRAAKELERMFCSAAADGVELVAISGFRSFERQKKIYEESVSKNGFFHTDRYIAKPGASEHQTGLAMDISSKELDFELEEEFAETPSGIWLRTNAHKFGYIVRYPSDKTSITGYGYEPWHVRFVGKKSAGIIYSSNITLEEFKEAFELRENN